MADKIHRHVSIAVNIQCHFHLNTEKHVKLYAYLEPNKLFTCPPELPSGIIMHKGIYQNKSEWTAGLLSFRIPFFVGNKTQNTIRTQFCCHWSEWQKTHWLQWEQSSAHSDDFLSIVEDQLFDAYRSLRTHRLYSNNVNCYW